MPRLHRIQGQLAQVGLDVLLDAAAHDVRVLPAPVDHALEVLVGELADGGDAARGLDAGQGAGLALLLLAGHVMSECDLGAEFLRGLACGGEGEIRVAADLHHPRLAGEAVAQSPAGRCALLSPGQHETIAVGAAVESFPGPDQARIATSVSFPIATPCRVYTLPAGGPCGYTPAYTQILGWGGPLFNLLKR